MIQVLILENAEKIANEINDFLFVNKGPKLAKEIRNVDKYDITFNTNNSIFQGGISKSDVLEVVRKFKNKNEFDDNNIDMLLRKEVIDSVLKLFTYICNLSFQTGNFHDKMKIAKVVLPTKMVIKHIISNCRPVSLLPQFSKILEKLFVNIVEKYKILSKHQYGFGNNRSTPLAVIGFVENITTAVDNKQCAVGVFVDLCKAFDTINHSLLLQKIKC